MSSAFWRSYTGKGGSCTVTEEPLTYETSVYVSSGVTMVFQPLRSSCAEMNARSTCCVSEAALPEPFWPMLGAQLSPSSVTVTAIPPPCTSASELLPTSEFESRPTPRVGRMTKLGSPCTCRAEVSAASGAVTRTVSGLAIS